MAKRICSKIDNCPKIDIIRDKDILDFQFAECVRVVCGKCKDFSPIGESRHLKAGTYNLLDPRDPTRKWLIKISGDGRIKQMVEKAD